MTPESRAAIYSMALSQWGRGPVLLVLAEECGELVSAVSKAERGRGCREQVAGELADVLCCLEQAAQLYGIQWATVEAIRDSKVLRMEDRLAE